MARRVTTVDTETWLFPQHTLEALARWLAEEKLDRAELAILVEEAVADRDLEIRATSELIQYRAGVTDGWHDIVMISALRGPQGERGIQGPPGADGVPAHPQVEFEVNYPTDTWVIPHTFTYLPSVTVVDTAGTVLEGEVTYQDGHTVVISFNVPVSGTAYLS